MSSTPLLDYIERAPFVAHSVTSRAAAEAIEPSAGSLRAAVLRFIQEAGEHGATDLEIQAGLSMDPSTERPRRGELVKAKKVVDSGFTRPTPSGRQAIVWKAVK